jgi:hypothetical protein
MARVNMEPSGRDLAPGSDKPASWPLFKKFLMILSKGVHGHSLGMLCNREDTME